jgi:ferric-dicitrate binding protein FerR (iron transport regulator)
MNEDWHDLIQRHMASLLSEAECQRFQSLLKSEPALRRLYLGYLNLDAGLGARAAFEDPVPQGVSTSDQTRVHSSRRFSAWLPVGIAACLCLALIWQWQNRRASQPWATVLGVGGVVQIVQSGDVRPAFSGHRLCAGETVRVGEDGQASLSVDGLGMVTLGPEANVRLARRDRALELASGFIEIEAQKQPENRPWRILTPEAEAAVIGTKFTLSACESRTALRVSEGLVQLTGLASGKTAAVAGGKRAMVTTEVAPPEVEGSRTGSVLLLTSRVPLNADWDRFNRLISDQLLRTRLWRLAFRVETRHFDDIEPSALLDRALIIVSVFPEGVGEPALERIGLPQVQVPVVCLEPAGYPVLGLVDGPQREAYGFASGETPVVLSPRKEHPLLQRLRASPDGWFRKIEGWGCPGNAAAILATIQDQPTHAVWFVYEAGEPLASGGKLAPARRVGLFLDPHRMTDHSSPVWEMFENSINWSVSMEVHP